MVDMFLDSMNAGGLSAGSGTLLLRLQGFHWLRRHGWVKICHRLSQGQQEHARTTGVGNLDVGCGMMWVFQGVSWFPEIWIPQNPKQLLSPSKNHPGFMVLRSHLHVFLSSWRGWMLAFYQLFLERCCALRELGKFVNSFPHPSHSLF